MRVDIGSSYVDKTESVIQTAKGTQIETTTSKTTTDPVQDVTGQTYSVSRTNVEKNISMTLDALGELADEDGSLNLDEIRQQLHMVSERMSADDYLALEEDGYEPKEEELDTIVTVLDEIKLKLLQAGIDISGWAGSLDGDEMEAMTGNTAESMELEKALQEQDLPVSEANWKEGTDALNQALALQPLEESGIYYLMENGLDSSISNLYRANHCVGTARQATRADDGTWDKIRTQAKELLEQEGVDVTKDVEETAKWLFTNGLEISAENVEKVQAYQELSLPPQIEEAARAVAVAIQQGAQPSDAVLPASQSDYDRAVEAYKVIQNATPQQAEAVIAEGKPLTIEQLRIQQQAEANEHTDDEKTTDINEATDISEMTGARETIVTAQIEIEITYRQVTARRQLEETRLMMTVQASYRLVSEGFDIETAPLSELVDQLKQVQQELEEQLFGNNDQLEFSGMEQGKTITEAQLFGDTLSQTERLKDLPAYLLGFCQTSSATIRQMTQSGETMLQEIEARTESQVFYDTILPGRMQQAADSYDTMRTEIRADLGDSISKAFSNVDDILKEMGLPQTEANERAVRILGYQSMEITTENLEQVKLADAKVQTLLTQMMPRTVMHLIQDGISPLDTPIDELNSQISQWNEENAVPEERYSEYLWKLEHNQEIDAKERETYVGVYRLLRQIEKSDGAVTGALAQAGTDLTMRNLLTGVKILSVTRKGLDVRIDKQYGEVEERTTAEGTILSQLESGFHSNEENGDGNVDNTSQYDSYCAQQALSQLSPDKLQTLLEDGSFETMTLEQFTEALKAMEEDDSLKRAYAQEQTAQCEEAMQCEDSVLRMLYETDTPVTVYNIMAAQQMLADRGKMYRWVVDGADVRGGKEALYERVLDGLDSPESMQETVEYLGDAAEQVMDGMLPPDHLDDSIDLRNMMLMSQQMKLQSHMAHYEQYTIPLNVAGEDTTMHLKIVRGTQQKGQVSAVFSTEELGDVAARFEVMADRLSGLIVTETEEAGQMMIEGQAMLKEALSEIESVTADANVELNIVTEPQLDTQRFQFDGKQNKPYERSSENEVQTSALYQTAKAFIRSVIKISATV